MTSILQLIFSTFLGSFCTVYFSCIQLMWTGFDAQQHNVFYKCLSAPWTHEKGCVRHTELEDLIIIIDHYQQPQSAQGKALWDTCQLTGSWTALLRKMYAFTAGSGTRQRVNKVPFTASLKPSPHLPISRARHANSHWAGCPVTWQAYDAYVMTEVAPTKLRSDACALRKLVDLFFQGSISEPTSMLVAWQQEEQPLGWHTFTHLSSTLSSTVPSVACFNGMLSLPVMRSLPLQCKRD